MRLAPRPETASHLQVEFFQSLASGAPVMIWMSGLDTGCFYFNRAWLEFRGRTMEEEIGNGWADGVHPDDLERCVQHYLSSFERRVSFAMSYRLRHHSDEYRWILDRGVPHFDTNGDFLGFYGGCAETPAEAAITRIAELRLALNQMKAFAENLAAVEAQSIRVYAGDGEANGMPARIELEHRVRAHAASGIGKLAADMLVHDRIPNGACLA